MDSAVRRVFDKLSHHALIKSHTSRDKRRVGGKVVAGALNWRSLTRPAVGIDIVVLAHVLAALAAALVRALVHGATAAKRGDGIRER